MDGYAILVALLFSRLAILKQAAFRIGALHLALVFSSTVPLAVPRVHR